MKKIFILIALLICAETNYAAKKQDGYSNYLTALNFMSTLFSRLLDNVDMITHRPNRVSFKTFAVNFNKKVNILLINENHFITILNNRKSSDLAFNNSLRIIQQNIVDIKKILAGNRGLIESLKANNVNTANIYGHLNTQLYENDELIREIHKARNKRAFKRKLADNLTASVVILNECHSKVAALYAKIK